MPHYRSLNELTLQNAWLTIGVFDGIHLGHQAILRPLIEGAHAEGNPAVVLTFDPHPLIVLRGQFEFKYLTTPSERATLLEDLGVDAVITQPFDWAFASQTAEEFMRRLVQNLGLRRLLIGRDFALGRDRRGNTVRLAEIGKELNYTVEVIAPVTKGGEVISSTHIRQQIAVGEVSAAAAVLGRLYAISGTIIHGDGRGKKINIPTANVEIPLGKAIPANGVYACWAWLGGSRYQAVTNIGIRPTFTPEEFYPHLEAHLLDFNKDIYGQGIKLEFVERLRPEQKFQTVDMLVKEIRADILRARKILT